MAIAKAQAGFRLFTGEFLNTIGNAINAFQGVSGTTPGPVTASQINSSVFVATNTEAVIYNRNVDFVKQGAATALTVSGTLTAAQILTGILTVLQGGGANSAQQLPLATAMDTAFPGSVAGDALDFSVINISVGAGETDSITTNTGWTLVGLMTQAITTSARFRAAKTAAGAWTLFRL